MKNSDLILQQGNPQATEDALQYDGKRCGHAEPPQPAPRLAQPKPYSQNDGQQANERSQKAMGVFAKDIGSPKMHGEQKHVVAIAGRPVGHSQASFVTRNQAAEPEQQEGQKSR